MGMNEVISIKYGCNIVAWTKLMHPRHQVRDLGDAKIHTSSKISKFC